jgi:hypothetical protein
MEYGVEKLKWFALFLLEGHVFLKLKAYQVTLYRVIIVFVCSHLGVPSLLASPDYQAVGTRQDGPHRPAAHLKQNRLQAEDAREMVC